LKRIGNRDKVIIVKRHFRGENAAASLKRGKELVLDVLPVRIFAAKIRGLIEATCPVRP
jgi:hypothetical protein